MNKLKFNKKVGSNIQPKVFNVEVMTFNQAKHVLNKDFNRVFVPYEVIDKNRKYFIF